MTFKGTDIRNFTSGFHVCWNESSMQEKKEVILDHNTIHNQITEQVFHARIICMISNINISLKQVKWVIAFYHLLKRIESKSFGIYHNEYRKIL